jgi:dienelactone hydrolase
MRGGGRVLARRPKRAITLLAGTLCLCLLTLAPGALAGTSTPSASGPLIAFGRVPCGPTEGVLFCQGSVPVTQAPAGCVSSPGNIVPCDNQVYDPAVPDTRVPSWDGTPLDTNVVLPAQNQHDLPLVILISGYPSQKTPLDIVGEYAGLTPRQWAEKGYAVLSYSNRGQFGSCGWPASRVDQPACSTGWQHLDSMAYEARDTQWLASLLADQGIVDPARIGVTGSSWGAGQSVELASLKNRVMLADGTLAPWVSPGRHLHMSIAAAAPMAAWSDLIPAVLPNGHDLDYTITPPGGDLSPPGVVKASFLHGLYAELTTDSYVPPPGVDPPLTVATLAADAGWPALSPADPLYEPTVTNLHRFRSPYYLPDNEAPAPLLWANGWNDDIFPVTEALRYVNKVTSAHPDAQISLFLSDTGHQRSQDKAADSAVLTQLIVDWFSHYLQGTGAPVLRGVEALTTTCPASAPSGGPYFAPSWPAMHGGEVRLSGGAAPQTVLSTSGDPVVDEQIDPILGPGVCASPSPTSGSATPGSATYNFPVPAGGFTMIGGATVIASMTATSAPDAPYPYVAAHLFDVAPGGTETLVARQTYRPSSLGPQVFQLYPQAWHFAPGHTIKLELVGQDAPYSRPDTLPGTITVSNLQLRLPTLEQPNCTTILDPAPPVVPAGEQLAPGVTPQPADTCGT